MKLKSFRIYNYKSIIDSGTCRLSDNDNILVLAGQNESGKSSILQALYDYERGKLKENSAREFDETLQYPLVKCTYTLDSDENLSKRIVENLEENITLPKYVSDIFSKMKDITIIRKFISPDTSEIEFDETLKEKLKNAYDKLEKEKLELQDKKEQEVNTEENTEQNSEQPVSPPAENQNNESTEEEAEEETIIEYSDLASEVFSNTPKIVFFDDFCDLLPDTMLVEDLKNKNDKVKGYKAVKNIETILETNLTELDNLSDAACSSKQDGINKKVTANFNEKWKQRVYKDNQVIISIEYKQGKPEKPGAYLNFYILTKEGEYLTPDQRSQGLKWFLSFYLQLTAESKKNDELIILFDEPGLFLHSKAQNDIKSLFQELAEKDQIIYSTHSPYLIDTDKLNRIRLIVNIEQNGTKIEKITTKEIANQKDALKPIIDAVGLEIAHCFNPVSENNIILEGISDFYYFSAMQKILEKDNEKYSFIPSMGADNVHLLMELCIGWGLKWMIIMDDDSQSKSAYKKIKEKFFGSEDENIDQNIHLLKGKSGIEEMFSLKDLSLVDPELKFTNNKSRLEIINGKLGKELFARIFSEKVNNKEIKKKDLTKDTIKNFESAFSFIEKNL